MNIEGGSFTLWEEFYNASIRLLKMEKYAEAKRLAKKSLNEAIDIYGSTHSTSGMSLFLLGLISQYQAEFTESEVFYEKALSIFERIFSAKDIVVLNVLQNLAFVYQSQGKYPEAEQLYKRVLKLKEEDYGKENSQLIPILCSLANLLKEMKKFGESEELYTRGLQILIHEYGPDHPQIGDIYVNLHNIYSILNKREEDKQLYNFIKKHSDYF